MNNDLISRKALLEQLTAAQLTGTDDITTCKMLVARMPPIPAAPVVHGHWIDVCGDGMELACSACNYETSWSVEGNPPDADALMYCNHCGARMGAEEAQREQG